MVERYSDGPEPKVLLFEHVNKLPYCLERVIMPYCLERVGQFHTA